MSEDLYTVLGFKNNPFSTTTAEEEKAYIGEIFLKPRYYSAILSDIKDHRTKFIFGDRGIGKSALMFFVNEELQDHNKLQVLIENYTDFSVKENEKDFLLRILQEMTKNIALDIFKKKVDSNNLTNIEKQKMIFFIDNFFSTLSNKELTSLENKFDRTNKINLLKRFFNLFNKSVNTAISLTTEAVSDMVRKSFGKNQPAYNEGTYQVYKEYIQEFKISKRTTTKEENIDSVKILKEFIKDLTTIIERFGYSGTVLFFDKIDEYPALNGNVNNISQFIREISKDTDLLYNSHISFVFFLWNKLKSNMREYDVRFDKFQPIDITWTRDEIFLMLERRIKFFSANKEIKFSDIVREQDLRDMIIDLAAKSPRNLLLLLQIIYEEQSNLDVKASYLHQEAIQNGMLKFVKTYNYSLLHSSNAKGANSIETAVNNLLRVGKIEFESTDLAAAYKVSSQSANSKIQKIKNYGLIEEIDNPGSQKKKYKVIEPKIVYAIEKGIEKLSKY